MRLERHFDAVGRGEGSRLRPIRESPSLPLPLEHAEEFGRPCCRDPIRVRGTIGITRTARWGVDLFRCESIVLPSYWVLAVMDQFTRRLVGFDVQCGVVTGADVCRMFNAAIRGQGVPDMSAPITIHCSRRIGGGRTCGFWKSLKSKRDRRYRCHIPSWRA